MPEILYRFARNQNGLLVDVTTVSRKTRAFYGSWECPACGAPMVIRLGDKRTHHFAHKNDSTHCSSESVWHKSAKLAFLQTFRSCVATGQPFLLSWSDRAECTHYEQHGIRCLVYRPAQIDLAVEYQHAVVEGGVGDFRADVLLTSATNNPPMFIEFAVTHPCTREKLESGHRILEITIRGDADVARLVSPYIDATVAGIQRYNFVPSLDVGDYCRGACDRALYVLRVYRNHDARIETLPAKEIFKDLDPSVCYQEVLGDKGPIEFYEHEFKAALIRYWGKGNSVRNCYLCIYHGSCGGRYQVFCKVWKQDYEHSEAMTCKAFKPFSSMTEFFLQDRRNEFFKSTPWGTPLPPRPKR